MRRTIILRKKGLHILVRNTVVEKIGPIGKLNRSPQITQRALIPLADLLLRNIMAPYFHPETNPVYIDRNIFRGDKIEIDPITHTLGKVNIIQLAAVGHNRFNGECLHDIQHLQTEKFCNKSRKIGIYQCRIRNIQYIEMHFQRVEQLLSVSRLGKQATGLKSGF